MVDMAKGSAQPAEFAMRKPLVGLMAIGTLIIFLASFIGGLGIPKDWQPSGVERQQEDLFAEVPALMAKLSEHPNDVDVLREIAEVFSQAQEWQKAVLFWGKVIELSPDDVNARYHRGAALMHMASFHDAIADYERIVSLDPGAYYALFYLGFISKYGLGEKDRAKEYFQRALGLEPQDQFLIETLREEIATL